MTEHRPEILRESDPGEVVYRSLLNGAQETARSVARTWEGTDVDPLQQESRALWDTSKLIRTCMEAVGGQAHRRRVITEGLRSGVRVDRKYDVLASMVTIPHLAEPATFHREAIARLPVYVFNPLGVDDPPVGGYDRRWGEALWKREPVVADEWHRWLTDDMDGDHGEAGMLVVACQRLERGIRLIRRDLPSNPDAMAWSPTWNAE